MSEGLSTKGIDTAASGGGLPKTLQPGNVMATLSKIELSQYSKMAKERNGFYVMLHLEGPAIEGFEGFFLDKDDEAKGRHKGQVAKVKTYSWPYADGETKGGTKVYRDIDIMKDMTRLCQAYGCQDWMDAQDGKHKTIEDLAEEFNKSCPLVGQVMNYCITGREYVSGEGSYKNWDLTLAKYQKNSTPYEAVTVPADESKLTKFDPNNPDHMEHVKEEKVQQFAGDIKTEGGDVDEDFEV